MKTIREKIIEIINNNVTGYMQSEAIDQIEKLISEEKSEAKLEMYRQATKYIEDDTMDKIRYLLFHKDKQT